MKKAKVAIALGLCMTILGENVCYAASTGVEWNGIVPSYTQGLW